MIGRVPAPTYNDCPEDIITKTTEIKKLFLKLFIKQYKQCSPEEITVAGAAFDALCGYNAPSVVSKVVRSVTCSSKFDNIAINISYFEDAFEGALIELGLAEKTKVSPCYRGVDLNFDENGNYTSMRQNIYLFLPDVATALHLDCFIDKLKEKVGEDICREFLLEAKLETVQKILSNSPK